MTNIAPLAFHVGDAALAALELSWQQADPQQRPTAQLALAWQLRQRDRRRALTLAAELESTARPEVAARLQLIRAEAAFLENDFTRSQLLVASARCAFEGLQELLGLADAHYLQARLAFDQGDMASYQVSIEAMRLCADGEPLRQTIAHAGQARALAFADPAASELLWQALNGDRQPPEDVACQCHIDNYRGTLAAIRGDFGRAIPHQARAYAQALASGQLLLAAAAAGNVGTSFNNVSDHHAALEWAELAQTLARGADLPAALGWALTLSGDTLRLLRRPAAARELLNEAQALLAGLPHSRPYAINLLRMGDLYLSEGAPAKALDCFVRLEQRAMDLRTRDLQASAPVGQARAQLAMGHLAQAAETAQRVLDNPRTPATSRIAALQLMASLHEREPAWPPPPALQAASPRLHYLQAAQQLAATLSDYSVPAELLDALARAHADLGDTQRAYAFAQQAYKARRATHSHAASNRALAMQVQRESLHMQAEAEQQRQRAAEQAQRSALLQQANDTLDRLAAIGRDIIGRLDEQDVCAVLHRHTLALLDAHTFAVYRLHEEHGCLTRIYGREDGRAMGPRRQHLDDVDSHLARCARERREILLLDGGGHIAPVAGTQQTLSSVFTPMLVGERLLGVLTIQSPRAKAYGERELAMLRSLGAFAATGLANAQVLDQLQQTQAQVLQQDKLAGLGELVASLGQEIQTPLAVIKSDGRSVAEALDRLLAELPQLLQALDTQAQALLVRLLGQLQIDIAPLNTRDERRQLRRLEQALARDGIADARQAAEVLLPLGSAPELELLLPLLRHQQRARILALMQQLSLLLSGTANVNAAADRVARVVQALKAYARIERQLDRQPTDLRESLETVLTLHQHRFRQGIALRCQLDALPSLSALPSELHRLWALLLDSALAGLTTPGWLELTLNQHGQEARLLLSSSATTDSGGDAPPAVKKILAAHGGRIEVERTIELGRRFTLYLPYAREAA